MNTTVEFFADEAAPRARVAALLQHFSRLEDARGVAGRLSAGGRERPRPHRNPPLHRLQDGRMDRRRQVLSGQAAFRGVRTLLRVVNKTESADRCHVRCARHRAARHRRARPLGSGEPALAARCRVQGRPLTLSRRPRAPKNMAVVRRFALGLVRARKSKRSVKSRKRAASWNTDYLLQILQMKGSLTRIPSPAPSVRPRKRATGSPARLALTCDVGHSVQSRPMVNRSLLEGIAQRTNRLQRGVR